MDDLPPRSYDRRVSILYDIPRQWRCRLCGCECYHPVSVRRKDGTRYQTPFYSCGGCTVLFMNDRQFDAAARRTTYPASTKID